MHCPAHSMAAALNLCGSFYGDIPRCQIFLCFTRTSTNKMTQGPVLRALNCTCMRYAQARIASMMFIHIPSTLGVIGGDGGVLGPMIHTMMWSTEKWHRPRFLLRHHTFILHVCLQPHLLGLNQRLLNSQLDFNSRSLLIEIDMLVRQLDGRHSFLDPNARRS